MSPLPSSSLEPIAALVLRLRQVPPPKQELQSSLGATVSAPVARRALSNADSVRPPSLLPLQISVCQGLLACKNCCGALHFSSSSAVTASRALRPIEA